MSTFAPPGLTGPVGTPPPRKQPAAPPGPLGPTAPLTPVQGPPSTALQQFGAYMSVQEFGQRLQAVHDAHVQQYGYAPSPTTAFHAAVATPPEQAATLYGPPAHQQPLLAALAAHPILTPDQLLAGAKQAQTDGTWQQYATEHEAALTALAKDPKYKGKLVAALAPSPATITDESARAAFAADPRGGIGVLGHALTQIAGSLVHAPGGAVTLVKDLALDVSDAATPAGFSPGTATGTPRPAPFHRTARNIAAYGHQLAQDVTHPMENAGYLFLDVLGFGSVAFSAAGRTAAATRSVRAGEGLSGAAKALTTPAELRTTPVRVGDYSENMPLSQNPLVAHVQEKIVRLRQKAADTRLEEGPSLLHSAIRPLAAQEFLDDHLSFERKVGRETDARLRVEFERDMALANELRVAAGSSLAHSAVLAHVPVVRNLIAKSGLSRGEQKAIQAASWDIDGGILDKIDAETDFHRRLIDMEVGSKRAHQRQIGDLALARKAVENPSERFTKAFDLTQQVVAEMQRKKIEELGLSPLTAEGAVASPAAVLRNPEVVAERLQLESTIAKLSGLLKSAEKKGGDTGKLAANLERAQARLDSLANPVLEAKRTGRVADDSFYLPKQPRGKVKRGPSQVRGMFGPSAGPYGVSLGRVLPELSHDFTGSSLVAGNYRIDATNLATEAYARTVRAITVKAQHEKLWDAASPLRRDPEHDIPIRDVNAIPDKLREVVARLDEGRFTQQDAELLPADIRAMTDELYPDPHTLTPDEMQHVRWIDGRLLGDIEGAPSRSAKTAAQIFQTINSPFRFGALYLRPAYALNKLGNHAMLGFDQGFLNTGVNIAKAMRLEETDGAKNAATIRSIVGSGKANSYVTSASGHVSRSVAEFWNRFADRDERVASFIYYADRKGYKTAEDRDRLLNDKAHTADLVEVTRRSKKALVEFDNQTPFEKNVLRHIIFVYPWVRGSAVWSLRAVMEHPMKTEILTQLGRAESENDPLLDKAAEWYGRVGYFPVGWAKNELGVDTPKVINPTSINTFSTIDEFLNVGRGLTVGDKTAAVADLLGPAAQFAEHVASGRDEFGNQYPNGAIRGALQDLFLGLPQLSSLREKKQHPVVAFNVTSRGSAVSHENSLARQAVFGPGWMGALGKWLAGGVAPRVENPAANEARYWNEQDPKVRAQHDLALINWALTQQGDFLNQPVPQPLRQAVRDHASVSAAIGEFRRGDGGGNVTAKQAAGIQLDYLAGHGRIPAAAAKKLRAQLRPLASDEIHDFRAMLWNTYGQGKQLRQWDRDVRLLWSFQKPTFDEKAARLHAQGLAPQRTYRNVPQKTLDEYGRGYLRFEADIRAIRADIKAGAANTDDLRVFTDQHSKPVNGLPSYAAIAWAHQSRPEQQHALVRITATSWGSLTSLEKQLAGHPASPELTLAWAAYRKSVVDVRKVAGSVDASQRVKLAQAWNRQFPGFMADWLYAQQPRLTRFKNSPVYKSLPERDLFDQAVTQPATQILQAVKAAEDAGTTGARTRAHRLWKTYVDEKLVPWLADHPKLAQALGANDRTFLEGMVSSG